MQPMPPIKRPEKSKPGKQESQFRLEPFDYLAPAVLVRLTFRSAGIVTIPFNHAVPASAAFYPSDIFRRT